MNILVPVDGSESSLNALKAAIKSAAQNASATTLHVVSVQPPIISGNVKRFISAENINEYYNEEGEKALAAAKTLLKQEGVAAETAVHVGPIAQTIATLATELKCDAIYMGTRGLGAISGVVLGSITTKVLNLVHIPVTLVR